MMCASVSTALRHAQGTLFLLMVGGQALSTGWWIRPQPGLFMKSSSSEDSRLVQLPPARAAWDAREREALPGE